jgi:hypothetical protein
LANSVELDLGIKVPLALNNSSTSNSSVSLFAKSSSVAIDFTPRCLLVLGRKSNISHNVNALTESIPSTTNRVMEIRPFSWKLQLRETTSFALESLASSLDV